MGKGSLDSTEKANTSDEPIDKSRSIDKFDSLPEAGEKEIMAKTLVQRMKGRRKTTSHGRRPKAQPQLQKFAFGKKLGSRGPAGFRSKAYPRYLNLESSQTNISLYLN